MKHLKEKQIIACALDLGETRWAGHLAGCAECQAQAARVQALLAAVAPTAAPEAPADLAARIGRALPPVPPAPRPRLAVWFAPARAAWLAAAGVVLAGGLFLARPRPQPAHPAGGPPGAGSRRGLLLAAAAHLDRTQALLVELKHAPAGPDGVINLTPERAAARQLLASNRFYQRTFTAGPPQAAGMAAATLARLEPVLIEIEHAPPRASRREWEAMELSIARNAVLFKVRVLQQTLRARALTSKEDGSL